jgi:hypothetical protein
MAADKDQLRTQLARPPSRHAPADTEVLGFVRCGKHDPAADSDRLTAQRWVNQLLDRGIKGIKVRMEDGKPLGITSGAMAQPFSKTAADKSRGD